MIVELRMCDADREELGGPEWLRLDTERVMDSEGRDLIRWEAECGYPIERAMGEVLNDSRPPAAATLVMLWLARKQGGFDAGGIIEETGRPEPYLRLGKVRTLRVAVRPAQDVAPESEGDAIPPASTPAR